MTSARMMEQMMRTYPFPRLLHCLKRRSLEEEKHDEFPEDHADRRLYRVDHRIHPEAIDEYRLDDV